MEPLVQGGIYLAKLNPEKTNEVDKVRPVAILTSQAFLNAIPPVVFICPLSSHSDEKCAALHLKLPARDNLTKPSFALVEHCRSIATHRITGTRLSQLTHKELAILQHRLQTLLRI